MDCIRRTRASYHYANRQVRKDVNAIIRGRISDVLVNDSSRNFWVEIKKIRYNKVGATNVVDGCAGSANISQVFTSK